jgi:hypothetical protein
MISLHFSNGAMLQLCDIWCQIVPTWRSRNSSALRLRKSSSAPRRRACGQSHLLVPHSQREFSLHIFVTDKLCSYSAVIGNVDKQETGRWLNNRAENSHQPFRRIERAMLRFRRMRTLQKLVAVHASVHNHFNQERHLYNRSNFKLNRAAALIEWCGLGVA